MAYTNYTAAQAVTRANSVTTWPQAMCLGFVRNCLMGAEGLGLYDANAAWTAARQKETTGTPPAGAPVYFAGYSHGHIALSLGGGFIRSTDVPNLGQVGRINIRDIEREWGIKWIGWSRDYGGRIIRGLEETTTNYGGIPTIPNTPTQPTQPTPQEDDMLSPEAQAWIEARMDAHDAYIIDSVRNRLTAEALFTGSAIIKDMRAENPDTAPRVTPSTAIEQGTLAYRVRRASGDTSALQDIAETRTQVAALAAAVAELAKKVDALPKA